MLGPLWGLGTASRSSQSGAEVIVIEDWVWRGPEHGPGSGVTLYLLYYLLPAAEEADLLDELAREREHAERTAMCAEFTRRDDDCLVELDHADPIDAEDRESASTNMTIGQIVGLLGHLLGAEVISDEPRGEGQAGDE
jgi:hypothetical protein